MARVSKGKVRYLRNLYRGIMLGRQLIANLTWQWEADSLFGTPVQPLAFYEQWMANHADHPILQAALLPGGLLSDIPRPLTEEERENNKKFSEYMDRLGALRWDEAEITPIRIKRPNEYTPADKAALVEATRFVMATQEALHCQTRSPKPGACI
jgi:hypothetical protein